MVKDYQQKYNQKETARIEAFSDGIFCVAITLLAIEIGVEFKANETNRGLAFSISALWPKFLAYLISFVNVLLAWIGHHSLFKNLKSSDNLILLSNGLLLMLIALVPFPTKTLGLYIQTGALKTAVVFYTGYFVLISLAFRLVWYCACRKKDLLADNLTQVAISKITRSENIGLASNTAIALMSFFYPWAGLLLSFIMWIYWMTAGE